MRIFKTILIGLLFAFLLWVVGCSAGLPVIPFVETDYFIDNSPVPLAHGFTITNTDDEVTELEIPDYFPDDDQCLDFWFKTSQGTHLLNVEEFRLKVFDENGNEIKPWNSYLFWNGGSEDEKFSIDDYEIDDAEKYVFFRTAVDLSSESSFSVAIEAKYTIDNKMRNISATYDLEKIKRLTWNELRAH
jgi:hypothetical protein